jgi:hypothetical protein
MNGLSMASVTATALLALGGCQAIGSPGGGSTSSGGKADSAEEEGCRDPLEIAVERLDTRWLDEHIASGPRPQLGYGDLPSERDWSDEQLAAFNEDLTREWLDELEATDAELTTSAEEAAYELTSEETAEAVASLGFVYSPENYESRSQILWSLEHVLDWLDASRERLHEAKTTGVAVDGEEREVRFVTYVNVETKRYVNVAILESFF